MTEVVERYLKEIAIKYGRENSTEYTYRSEFERFLKDVFATIKVQRIDHDPKTKDSNKPDFIVVKDTVPLLYVETKDIGMSLDKVEESDQMKRYYGYANLVLTDYLEFRFYRNGIAYGETIKIADYHESNRTISTHPDKFDYLTRTLLEFTQSHKEPIKSGGHLSKIMGGKAQRIRENVNALLVMRQKEDAEIIRVYRTIKQQLVHDLTLEEFADMYAQTLVYGLFVARFHDKTPNTFTRQEARELIPASNPFLLHFFDHIVGPNFEKRLEHIVDELCIAFSHSDIKKLMYQHYGKDLWGDTHTGPDPVVHFYEDFLKDYDAKLRKKMGAYYTPTPVVRYIVNSVDQILEKEFKLNRGLADTTKNEKGIHRVQILDPAVGTGTFISAVIRKIYEQIRHEKQEGGWPSYVHHNLLPRLHGFELMMAPYTISHLKLSTAFEKTGFIHFNKRLGIYLTNTLESAQAQKGLFSDFGLSKSISEESIEASRIKNDLPIMIIVGNPPYSGISSNNTEYANALVTKYKVEPGGKQKLQERKHWLNDDYVKFISFAESHVNKTGEGVVGMITPHGYLDNPTFRGMRWHLMKTFSKIYILDLHGNSNKKEVAVDGTKDENVFNIKTGVSIMLAIKHKNSDSSPCAEIYKSDLYGRRREKLKKLRDTSWKNTAWEKLEPKNPHYYFTYFDYKAEEKYKRFISVAKLFPKHTSGVVTMGDNFAITKGEEEIIDRLLELKAREPSEQQFKEEYKLGKNYGKWLLGNMESLELEKSKVTPISYRPFDNRYTYFDNKVLWRWRGDTMKSYTRFNNIGLLTTKGVRDSNFRHCFVTKHVSEAIFLSGTTATNAINFPMFYVNNEGKIVPNVNKHLVKQFEKALSTPFLETTKPTSPESVFTMHDMLDYVYAILNSESFRKKYKDYLKTNFPHIPLPISKSYFFTMVELGRSLRELHLLETPKLSIPITSFPEQGSGIVDQLSYKGDKVWINEKQYFGGIPEIAWDFYIGGYQPAQKWLKDRKGQTLAHEDIEHYQKIIVALVETQKIMKEIDKVIEL